MTRRPVSPISPPRPGSASPATRVVVFDTGGGSSQFTFGRGDAVEEQFSVPVGAVRLTERHGLDGSVSEETLARRLRRASRPSSTASTAARRPTRSSGWAVR